ncbi:kinase-like domain-containing protein [Collybia nuda]|uniref:Kinase-like domain-containing protein n=1 Tax=Collybia nuda TaxID=64659 RepID=A0A9P5Y3V8_9AGAR|nr:kinase-like domain-containing protein [Collybia nuda]
MSTPTSTPLRTKRNFKSLQLPASALTPPVPPPKDTGADPFATRSPPAPGLAGMKKRPPPLGENATPAPGFLMPGGGLGTGLDSALGTGRRSAMHATLSSTLAKLDMNALMDLNLQDSDLRKLSELGQGNGGSVVKVEHVPTGTIMAKKIVLIDAKQAVRKQILRELEILHSCRSAYIVSSYGAFMAEPNICICMEFMDKGSFDGIYKTIGPIDIEVVAKVALAVLEGLTYLYDVHRIIHRDIKPSNILCNSQGEIKLCDFGVSGELINSIANTFVGTSVYMSPERIQGAEYSIKSDVWSLGISLIELALGRFPFSESDPYDPEDDYSEEDDSSDPNPNPTNPDLGKTATHRDSLLPPSSGKTARRISKRRSKGVSLHGGGLTMSIIELMHHIVREPAPRLSSGKGPGAGAAFPTEAEEFVDACLLKDPEERKPPGGLLKFSWMDTARMSIFDIKEWASTF